MQSASTVADRRLEPGVPERGQRVGDARGAPAHPQGQRRLCRQRHRCVLRLLTHERVELVHGPRRETGASRDGFGAGAARRRRWVGREPAQDRVDEATLAYGHEIHRGRDRRMGRHVRVEQLVGAESQRVAGGRRDPLDRPTGRGRDRRIQREPTAQCAEREIHREGAVACLQAGSGKQARQEPVGVRAVVDHAPDGIEGHGSRGRRRAHPSRSPSANRAPRAHAAASIRRRPAGATSTRRTPPLLARTRTPRSSAATIVPGSPADPW